jgi:glutamine amidotransferase
VSREVAVVDYGRGNLFSVARALESVGAAPYFASAPGELRGAGRVVLPGVGAFGDAMAALDRGGLAEAVRDHAAAGRPLLGICLGTQLFLETSREFGEHRGLGLIPGEVRPLPRNGNGRPKVPNVGWARLFPSNGADWRETILGEVEEGAYAYFVHSFHAMPREPGDVLAVQRFGDMPSAAVIARGNVVGCQFHPEKSGAVGHRILAAWLAA